jgi:hypothetical protein
VQFAPAKDQGCMHGLETSVTTELLRV